MSPNISDFDYMLQLFKAKPEVLLTLSMCYLSKQPKSLSHVLVCEVCVRLSNPDESNAVALSLEARRQKWAQAALMSDNFSL